MIASPNIDGFSLNVAFRIYLLLISSWLLAGEGGTKKEDVVKEGS